MNVHDWSHMPRKAFHDFHQTWIVDLKVRLNGGLLPPHLFARVEQHIDDTIPDVLTLEQPSGSRSVADAGDWPTAVAVAAAPPRAMIESRFVPQARPRRRTVTVREAGDERLVAVIEIVSAANKDRRESVAAFAGKVASVLRSGAHAVVIDLLPPNRRTPAGMHAAIARAFRAPLDDIEAQPHDRPVALMSYSSEMPEVGTYVNFLAVGEPMPDMPLFLTPGRYITLPLAATYEQAFDGMAAPDRDRLTHGRRAG